MITSKRRFVPPSENYFSIDDIIATNEKVPCRFDIAVPKLGFLDPSTEEEDLKQGSKLDLPLWMVQNLFSRQIVSIEMPKVYREGYREILNADAEVVDLFRMGPYFYHFGLYLRRFPHHESEDIAKMLSQTFRNRFRRLMDSSQNSLDEDVTSLTSRLDRTEMVLFNLGQKTLYDLKLWQEHKIQKIAAADVVVNKRKRKRVAMEESP